MRLEQDNSGNNSEDNSFQFHKGAIRTAAAEKAAQIAKNFNSIKVRLELLLTSIKFFTLHDFNSIKVRLEHGILKNEYYMRISIP